MADLVVSRVQIASPRLRERLIVSIGPELCAIDAAVATEIAGCPVPLVSETGNFITNEGGLRLRAALLLLAARLTGYRGPLAVRMGHIVEVLHAAMLIHDRLVEHAPSGNDDSAMVLVGDYLYSRAFDVVVQNGDFRILDILARSVESMTEAQVFELEQRRSGRLSEADYLQIIEQRTGTFMSACCRIGGVLGRSNPEQLEGLARYGRDLGIALEISNDVLDGALELARAWARSAKKALHSFTDGADKETLALIADFIVDRDS